MVVLKDMAYLQEKKRRHEKITMLTCYDYPTAVLEDAAGVDILFVGDSLGTNVLGYDREVSVSLQDVLHHLKAARRGVHQSYLLADIPYRTYQTPTMALETALQLRDAGADGVKFEGFQPEVVQALREHQFEVCGHLGYNPQYHEKAAVQGKTRETATKLYHEALQLEQAGLHLLVLELVPEELGGFITEQVTIPTIGIGAGRYTDGQVLIVHDMLGITPMALRHSREFAHVGDAMREAFAAYVTAVQEGAFPTDDNVRHLARDVYESLHDSQRR